MSQFDFGTIDANVKTGTQLAADLNQWRDALHSSHAGAARPAYVRTGMLWVDTSGAPAVNILKLYDGAADVEISRWNSTTHVGTAYIPLTQKAAASGVASLDASTKIPVAQIPDLSAIYLKLSGGTMTGQLSAFSSLLLQRQDAVSEGGQIDFARASDGVLSWSIDVNGAGASPNFRLFSGVTSKVALTAEPVNGKVTFPVAPGSTVAAAAAGDIPRYDQVIPLNTKGVANGVASLDAGGFVPQAQLDTIRQWTKPQRTTPVADNDGSMDLNAANDFICTPTAAITLQFTNRTDGQRGMIFLNNAANYAVTFAANTFKSATAAADLSATGFYILSYWCINGGQVWITHSEKLAA